jgi:LacI family transcriptional regulator
MRRTVTQQSIARKAKVSQATVSLILSGQDKGISGQTRDAVLKTARRLGYWKEGRQQQRTGIAGYLFPAHVDPTGSEFRVYYHGALMGAQRMLERERCHTLLGQADLKGKRLEEFAERVDGVIVHDDAPEHVLVALSAKRPVVLLNWWAAPGRFDTVAQDHESAIRAVIQHLHGLGHRRIAFLNHRPLGHHHEQRWRVYRAEMTALGLTPLDDGPFSPETREQTVEETDRLVAGIATALRRQPTLATAIICPSDTWALPLLKAVLAAGLKVPGDVSIVGYDDDEACRYATPALSSVRVPMGDLGKRAAEVLLRRLESADGPRERILLAGTFLARGSLGPVKEKG